MKFHGFVNVFDQSFNRCGSHTTSRCFSHIVAQHRIHGFCCELCQAVVEATEEELRHRGIEGMVTSFPGMVASQSVNNPWKKHLFPGGWKKVALEKDPIPETNKLQLKIRPFQKEISSYDQWFLGTMLVSGRVHSGSKILLMYFSIASEFQIFLFFRIWRIILIDPGIPKIQNEEWISYQFISINIKSSNP